MKGHTQASTSSDRRRQASSQCLCCQSIARIAARGTAASFKEGLPAGRCAHRQQHSLDVPATVTSSTCTSQPLTAAAAWLLLVASSLPGFLGLVLTAWGTVSPVHCMCAAAAAGRGFPSAPLRVREATQRSVLPARDSDRVAVTVGVCICRQVAEGGGGRVSSPQPVRPQAVHAIGSGRCMHGQAVCRRRGVAAHRAEGAAPSAINSGCCACNAPAGGLKHLLRLRGPSQPR